MKANINYTTNPNFLVEEKLKIVEMKNKFFEQLEEITSKYNVDNNVFGFKDGNCTEILEGYYNEIKKINNLNDIREEFDINKNLIRIQNNEAFFGEWHKSTSEICEGLTIDLKKKMII